MLTFVGLVCGRLFPDAFRPEGRNFVPYREQLVVERTSLERGQRKPDFWLGGYITNTGNYPWRVQELEVRFMEGGRKLVDVQHPRVPETFVVQPRQEQAFRVELGRLAFPRSRHPQPRYQRLRFVQALGDHSPEYQRHFLILRSFLDPLATFPGIQAVLARDDIAQCLSAGYRPGRVQDMHTSGTAQTRHKLHTRLRQLSTGRMIDRVFAENERVPVAPLETRRVTYSYAKGETFDEFESSKERLGERRWFLKENEDYKVLLLDGILLDIVVPPQIPLKVVDTAPPARGGLDSSWKEAKLETGLQIMVRFSSPRAKPSALTPLQRNTPAERLQRN